MAKKAPPRRPDSSLSNLVLEGGKSQSYNGRKHQVSRDDHSRRDQHLPFDSARAQPRREVATEEREKNQDRQRHND